MPESPVETTPNDMTGGRHTGWRIVLPAAAFLGGFAWDVFTLGRRFNSIDLAILALYFVAAAVILVAIGRRIEFRGSTKLNLALQFLFGGMFSALVILYFMSSGGLLGTLMVGALAVMLVVNEFLGEKYDRLSLSWAVFGVCGVMLLNFVLPYLMRSIHPMWFYVSLAGSVGLVIGLGRLSRDEDAVVWPTLAAAGLLALLQFLNFIPPVPLAARSMVIGSEVARANGEYVVRGRTSTGTGILSPRVLILKKGNPVYCFTSIFVPPGIETVITHHWMKLDPVSDEWTTTDRISFAVVGGRLGGYRGYTLKQRIADGQWKVEAVAETGQVIASTRFRIDTSGSTAGHRFERRY